MDSKPLTKGRANIRLNKKAFQYDAYHPLFWCRGGRVGVSAQHSPPCRQTPLRVVMIKNDGQLVTVRLKFRETNRRLLTPNWHLYLNDEFFISKCLRCPGFRLLWVVTCQIAGNMTEIDTQLWSFSHSWNFRSNISNHIHCNDGQTPKSTIKYIRSESEMFQVDTLTKFIWDFTLTFARVFVSFLPVFLLTLSATVVHFLAIVASFQFSF